MLPATQNKLPELLMNTHDELLLWPALHRLETRTTTKRTMTASRRLLENQTKTNRASPKGTGSLPGGLAFDTAVTLAPPKGPLMRCITSL